MWLKKFNELRKSSGMNLDDISKKSGVPMGTLSKITSGITKSPSIETIKAIVYSMGYTLDDLDDKPKNAYSLLEQEHIKKYRALDDHGKKVVNLVLEEESNRMEEMGKNPVDDEEDNLIYLNLSEQPASAGNGVYLGVDNFSQITVIENELTSSAKFAVPIKGNSMEPKYHDGDILLVSDEYPNEGDIGIFTLDGEGYVKKLGDEVLISLNQDYDDIPMDESILSNGKVIGVLNPDWVMEW